MHHENAGSMVRRLEAKKRPDNHTPNKAARWHKLAIVLFWLALWQVLAMLADMPIFFVSPLKTLTRLITLMGTARFYRAVARTTLRILAGYLLSALTACVLALLSKRHRLLREILQLPMMAVRTIPVVSFIILALICLPSRYLSVLISFLMVLPIFYSGILTGLDGASQELEEMSRLFGIRGLRHLRYVLYPQLQAQLTATAVTAVGFAWKSGTAAEVIGIPSGSIGERLQQAKIYLMTPDLFAWTVVIVVMCVLCEKMIRLLLKGFSGAVMRMPEPRRVSSGGDGDGPDSRRFADDGITADGRPAGINAAEENGRSSGDRLSAVTAVSGAATDLRLEHVRFSYSDAEVFRDLNARFEAGSVTAVMAPSGAGKTTLLRLIAGLETPDQGAVRSQEGMRCAAVFQEDRLVPALSAYANVRLACPQTASDWIRQSFEELGLAGDLDKRADELSGGMRRRTALIRAMLSDGSLVLLDEPFKGLDEEMREQTMAYVLRHLNGRTLILVTHEEQEAEGLKARVLHLGEMEERRCRIHLRE